MTKFKTIVGIDEVGRGPIAGPVAVCALCICQNQNLNHENKFTGVHFRNFKDSKKLSHLQRLGWLEKIEKERKKGNICYCVSFEGQQVIDKHGIVFAINRALKKSLHALRQGATLPEESKVLLDGGLKAPSEYKNQTTIIKGDEKKLVIALASIVAKVKRDELMVRLAKKYPQYGFEQHKGYGTKSHYAAIARYGISALHRKSFLRKLIK